MGCGFGPSEVNVGSEDVVTDGSVAAMVVASVAVVVTLCCMVASGDSDATGVDGGVEGGGCDAVVVVWDVVGGGCDAVVVVWDVVGGGCDVVVVACIVVKLTSDPYAMPLDPPSALARK